MRNAYLIILNKIKNERKRVRDIILRPLTPYDTFDHQNQDLKLSIS